MREERRKVNGQSIVVLGARANNLKNIDVGFPLGVMTVVTGVSGSGKSTLVNDILYARWRRRCTDRGRSRARTSRSAESEEIDKVIRIDQSPIGRTPRSNPATYTGVFTQIRELYAMLPESRERGYKAGRFSFNVSGGRCEACQGEGERRIEMNFLPDVYVLCEVCGGKRYNRETLAVHYKGYTIADLLDTPISEALAVLENIPQARQKLQTLVDVGLGYIHLGQSSVTLSGGEAQRIKLARELSKRQTGRTLYLLDEPTTGLHFEDVRRLLEVLHRLTDLGNSDHHHRTQSRRDSQCGLDHRPRPRGRRRGRKNRGARNSGASCQGEESYTGQALSGLFQRLGKRWHSKRRAKRPLALGGTPVNLSPDEPPESPTPKPSPESADAVPAWGQALLAHPHRRQPPPAVQPSTARQMLGGHSDAGLAQPPVTPPPAELVLAAQPDPAVEWMGLLPPPHHSSPSWRSSSGVFAVLLIAHWRFYPLRRPSAKLLASR